MKLKLYIFSLILLSIATVSAQDVSFTSKVNKKKLGINERLRIDFEVNQDGDNFKRPDFKGFTIYSGPNQAVSRSWSNGKGTYSKTFSYILVPQKRGKIAIEQAEITIKGEVYKSAPLEVTITAAVNKPKDGNDAAYIASEKIHLVAEVSKSSPYLNQAFTVVYKLYVSP